jgi:hypothetical protein
MDDYGFIISRHVKNEKTNRYWNQAVRLLRTFYPLKKIVIIDDNSDARHVKAEFPYRNLEVIQSEFPGRGELLPYYYFFKHRWFANAVIMHDSVFFHKRVSFEKYLGRRVVPLWHFNPDKENFVNSLRIASVLKNGGNVKRSLIGHDVNVLGITKAGWRGCFGVQAFINHGFLSMLQTKYNIFRMLSNVKCRLDRCCLERIMGVLFCLEAPEAEKISAFGVIFQYMRWGYTFDEYMNDIKHGVAVKPVIKTWTGR